MLLQPRLYLALTLYALLQVLERCQARFQLRQIATFAGRQRLCRATLFFHARQLFLGLFQHHRCFFECRLLLFQLLLEIVQVGIVGECQTAFFLEQAITPDSQTREDIGGITLMRRLELDLLLDLHDLAA